MNARLYLLSTQQKKTLADDVENVLKKCSVIANKERDEMRENKEMHDDVCPNCRTKKDKNNIVNKISQVRGSGNVSSGIFFTVTGSVSINTYPVNHCNNCGNEWEKFKTKSISETDVLRVCLNYLGAILKNSDEKKREWKMDAIKVFDDCYAETIHKLCRKEKRYLHATTSSELKLFKLKRYYRSIFDNKNKRELEKI